MITIDELNLIIKNYSLGRSISSIEQLTDGWTNITCKFQIESSNEIYVLREYVSADLQTIKFELKFLRYLFEGQQQQLPVVPSIDPPGIIILSNQHYATLFPFISGRKYLNSERDLWQIIEISRFLGRLHSIDFNEKYSRRTINIPHIKYQLINCCENFRQNQPIIYERIRRIVDEKTESIPLIENECEQIQFENDFEVDLPKGFIHLDVHDENVLFHHELKQIVAVLDFDELSYGPFLLDIAMTLCFWCLVESKFKFDYVRIFLIEYQQSRAMNLTENEWIHLELYCYLVFLHQILFLIELNECRPVETKMFEELIQPLEQIYANKTFLKIIQQ